jgi:hypothetical protein
MLGACPVPLAVLSGQTSRILSGPRDLPDFCQPSQHAKCGRTSILQRGDISILRLQQQAANILVMESAGSVAKPRYPTSPFERSVLVNSRYSCGLKGNEARVSAASASRVEEEAGGASPQISPLGCSHFPGSEPPTTGNATGESRFE